MKEVGTFPFPLDERDVRIITQRALDDTVERVTAVGKKHGITNDMLIFATMCTRHALREALGIPQDCGDMEININEHEED